MQTLIKDGQLTDHDGWQQVSDASSDISGERCLLPLSLYIERQSQSDDIKGVWLDEADMPETLTPYLGQLSVIALYFPKFADGRAFSKARLLRERLGFKGEIRAIGDFLPDQVSLLARCGVNAFECRTDSEAETALGLLGCISVFYQSDVNRSALFERRASW